MKLILFAAKNGIYSPFHYSEAFHAVRRAATFFMRTIYEYPNGTVCHQNVMGGQFIVLKNLCEIEYSRSMLSWDGMGRLCVFRMTQLSTREAYGAH